MQRLGPSSSPSISLALAARFSSSAQPSQELSRHDELHLLWRAATETAGELYKFITQLCCSFFCNNLIGWRIRQFYSVVVPCYLIILSPPMICRLYTRRSTGPRDTGRHTHTHGHCTETGFSIKFRLYTQYYTWQVKILLVLRLSLLIETSKGTFSLSWIRSLSVTGWNMNRAYFLSPRNDSFYYEILY